MAEKKAPATAEEPAAGTGGRKKKLILIAAAAAGVLLLGILAGVLLLGGKDKEEGDAEETEHAAPVPALYVALGDKFVVTLPGEGKPHYFQVAISAMTHEQSVVEELEFNAPLIRDRLNSLLARQEFDKLRTEEGKVALRGEILATVQGILAVEIAGAAAAADDGEADEDEDHKKAKKKSKDKNRKQEEPVEEPAPGVEQVFFTEFVLQ